MRVVSISRNLAEQRVVVIDVRWHEGVGSFDGQSRSAARMGLSSPSITAWMHFNRSKSRIANVTVLCRIRSLQSLEREPEATRGQR